MRLSGITWNADCAGAVVVRRLARVAAVADAHGRRVALVGHSRGDLFARVSHGGDRSSCPASSRSAHRTATSTGSIPCS